MKINAKFIVKFVIEGRNLVISQFPLSFLFSFPSEREREREGGEGRRRRKGEKERERELQGIL